MAYSCRNIYCRKCNKEQPEDHICKKNHDGSSKAMEASMAIEVVLKNDQLVKHKCRIKTLIGDDDSSAIAGVRRLAPYQVIKFSDYNQAFKTWNSKLYEMKISPTLKEYFSKSFSTCVKKNKENEVKVKEALENIIPHAFGNHENCGDFCTKNEAGEHEYTYFKNKKCLTDLNLRAKLEKALEPFIKSAAQIAPCAFSQPNESFNHTVCTKHPKNMFYGGSDSHEFRVESAVCQKNDGYKYIIRLNKKLELSPGYHSQKFRNKKDAIFKTRLSVKKTVAFKKRRLFLRKKRCSKNAAKINSEGVCYQSGASYFI